MLPSPTFGIKYLHSHSIRELHGNVSETLTSIESIHFHILQLEYMLLIILNKI